MTATVGFLAARLPNYFLPLFGVDDATSVSVEETSEDERFDVILRGRERPIVIEGKVGLRQDPSQLLRYARRAGELFGMRPQLALIDRGSGASMAGQGTPPGFHGEPIHVTWTQVARACRRAAQSRKAHDDRIAVAVAQDLADHLEESSMIEDARKDIYSRDVSTRPSIELIFRHRIYSCQASFLKSASSARYFAPYFTAASGETFEGLTLVPVPQGISYVAAIKAVELVARKDFMRFLKAARGAAARDIARIARENHEASAEREFLFMELGQPYQLFHPPVTKRQLGIVGSMGAQSFSLERLLEATTR